MHPADRVRIVVQTARAVLRDELDVGEAAAVMAIQREQIGDLLRGDRIDVPAAEAATVALTLRRLAEQVGDAGSGTAGSAHQQMAALLGELSQTLR